MAQGKPVVEIGRSYSPGTIVRLPDVGVYYEVPKHQGEGLDRLQAALLAHYTPKQIGLSYSVATDFFMRYVEHLDRMYFAFMGMFGVTR